MIVGAINAITKAPLTQRTVPANPQSGDDPSDALYRLGNLTEAAAHSRKALAEERLKQLREQMSQLMLFDMTPGALAGQSAQFAKELKATAEDFAGAFEALAAIANADTAGMSLAQQAYLDLDDGPQATMPVHNEADMETMARFASTARQIDSMAERVSGRLDPRDGAVARLAEARSITSAIVGLMTSLSKASAPRAFYW